MAPTVNPLIEPEDVFTHLNDKNWVLLDATFALPAQNRNPQSEFRETHLPGARFFDIDTISATNCDLPHMLPSPQAFAESVSTLGIDNDTQVIVYDSNLFMASARVWWMFRTFGHDNVRVLNGGLQRWKTEGRPVTDEMPAIITKTFTAQFNPERVRTFLDMQRISADGSASFWMLAQWADFLATTQNPDRVCVQATFPGVTAYFPTPFGFRNPLSSDQGSTIEDFRGH